MGPTCGETHGSTEKRPANWRAFRSFEWSRFVVLVAAWSSNLRHFDFSCVNFVGVVDDDAKL